ncbi:MAG TPA: hypothetical protein VKW08_04925 [Xanthobacteraceae bacterium]|jgi:hypothetical protein|nr:hypothetical protein [Xanthobacteraceae bacterium]
MPQDTLEFPVIEGVEGGLSGDGELVLLKLSTVEDESIHFCLRSADIEAFVTYLLCMAASRRGAPPCTERVRYQPIPASCISAGELADGMGCLGVTVGATELMFQLPISAVSKVAETLMLVGATAANRAAS